MQNKASTVKEYLASLPEDRRRAIEAVRNVILKNLDKDYEEGIQYGMIGYYVPHRVFPAGYHCDPKQPLPMAALGSQKNHMSLHLMCIYAPGELQDWFKVEWNKTGKKLDMGKACLRFKTADDLALDVIAALFKRITAKKYIANYEAMLSMPREKRPGANRNAKSKAASRPQAKPSSKSKSKPKKAVKN